MKLYQIGMILRLASLLCATAIPTSAPVYAQMLPDPIVAAQDRFNVLYGVGRFADAVPLAEEVLALVESHKPQNNNMQGAALYQLGNVLIGVSRYAEAESFLRRAIAVFSAQPPLIQPRLQSEVMLATALVYQSKLDEGVPMMQRAAAAFETEFGIADPRTVSTLNNFAQTLQVAGRSAEAEPIYRKLISVLNPNVSSNLTNLGALHGNLAAMLTQLGRRDEAIAEMRLSVEFLRRIGNPAHKFLAIAVGNLGKLEHDAGNLQVAERHYRESLESGAKSDGPESEVYAGALTNLAVLYRDLGRQAEAETAVRQAIAIFEQRLGRNHPKTGSALNSLAILKSARGAWHEALDLYDRATEIAVRSAQNIGSEDGQIADEIYGLNPGDYPAHMRAIYHVAPADPARREQAFGLAQRALNSKAAVALSRMANRAAAPGSVLSKLLREQHDLLARRAAADQALVAAMGATMEKSRIERAAVDLAAIDHSLNRINGRLKAEFPDFVAFDGSHPVTMAEIQRVLKPNEAMIAFVEVQGNSSIASNHFAWVLTTQSVTWMRLEVSSDTLAAHIATLRCGLDGTAWHSPTGRTACERLTGRQAGGGSTTPNPLPFDTKRAHELYSALLKPIEHELRLPNGNWRELFLVTSGALTSIPLSVLVTAPPVDGDVAESDRFRKAQWLGTRQPMAVLPSIASLVALRRVARPTAANRPMIGIGNPLLDGGGSMGRETALEALRKQECAPTGTLRLASVARRVGLGIETALKTRGGLADVRMIRSSPPLPETADEICAIATSLGADTREMRLGARATESELKSLSAAGQLSKYRIVHFATHGLLAGQLQANSEPGLILTPPAQPSEQDDGFLSASEVAGLKLDADWVILSACNTAGPQGGTDGSNALSGLARAFFYAGARTLLVSHWEVASQATVQLVSETIGAIARDPSLGRSAALQRAMASMITSGDVTLSHPAYWAPFIVVGEGSVIARAKGG